MATLTRQHFEFMAERIHDAMQRAHAPDHGQHQLFIAADVSVLTRLAHATADELAYTNPRFNRSRFLAACGVVE